jgi:phytanoyl-CoA hydroxylase
VEPRLAPIPVRLPLPPAARQGSIYENQAGAARFYFEKTGG